MIASQEMLNKFTLAKQSMDLCTNVFSQYVAYEYIKGGYLDNQVIEIRKMYKRKRDIMLDAINKYFPKEVKWTVPKGGMFLWVTLPKHINTRIMFSTAIANQVVYVVGDAFYPDGSTYNTMRLNFSYSEDNVITEGIKRLANVIKQELSTFYEIKSKVIQGV